MAKQVVHWPGKDTVACDEHLKKLVGLGAVLGFPVTWTACEDDAACDNCENEKRHEARLAQV